MRRPIRVRHQVVFELTSPALLATQTELEVVRISQENVDRIGDFRPESVVRKHVELLRGGRVGLLAVFRGDAVGHAWIDEATVDNIVLNGYLRVHDHSALIHDCHVAPTARGQAIYPEMIIALHCLAKSRDPQVRVLIDTARSNSASQRGIVRSGAVPIGKGTYIFVAGRLALSFQRIRGFSSEA